MTFSAHLFAFIEGIGGPELMMIMLVVLLLFGGKKLPEFARGLGKSMREFKKAASGVEEEIRRAMDEPTPPPTTPAPRPVVPATATHFPPPPSLPGAPESAAADLSDLDDAAPDPGEQESGEPESNHPAPPTAKPADPSQFEI